MGYDDSIKPPAVQLGLVLFNAANGPIKYEIEQLEVVIEDRTKAEPTFANRGGTISRGMTGVFFYPRFDQELPKRRDHFSGVIRFTVRYGHPEVGFLRRLRKELSFSLRVGEKVGIVWMLRKESDESI